MGYEKPSTKLTFYKAFFSSQWKFLIYTILQSMSAKRTSWNEFRSAMASAVICLSTGRKFNFSKYIFESLVKNVDSSSKFYMYPRFIQLIIKNQLGKGFSRVETPLFKGMLVGVIEEQGDAEEQVPDVVDDAAAQGADTVVQGDAVHEPSIPSPTPPNPPPQKSQDLPSTSQVQQTPPQSPVLQSQPPPQAQSQAADFSMSLLQEALDAFPAATITAALIRVAAASTRRRKGVVIRDLEEESTTIIPADTKSKDKGKGIMVEEPKPLKKKQQVEMDKESTRKLHEELNKDIDWDVAIDHVKQKAKEDPFVQRYQNVAGFRLDYFKGMSYDDMHPIFKAKFNSNIAFLLKSKEQLEEEENRAIESINKTPAQKAAKRRKLNKEVEDLKRNLEIMPDEDDDVYTEATPLARKVPIVDYEIIHLNNKPHYKIIRADGTHQLPDGQAQVWKSQRTIHGQAKVKSWKLLESCAVHIITFTTAQLILLVERRYPLLRFTLDQMLNAVRLRVEEYSEMSLELLRKNTKCLMLLMKDLMLPSKVAAAGLVLLKDELMLLSQVNTANVILMLSRQS
nr:glutamic acid-rich protein-like [Tanacetum cinerariifolium]